MQRLRKTFSGPCTRYCISVNRFRSVRVETRGQGENRYSGNSNFDLVLNPHRQRLVQRIRSPIYGLLNLYMEIERDRWGGGTEKQDLNKRTCK